MHTIAAALEDCTKVTSFRKAEVCPLELRGAIKMKEQINSPNGLGDDPGKGEKPETLNSNARRAVTMTRRVSLANPSSDRVRTEHGWVMRPPFRKYVPSFRETEVSPLELSGAMRMKARETAVEKGSSHKLQIQRHAEPSR